MPFLKLDIQQSNQDDYLTGWIDTEKIAAVIDTGNKDSKGRKIFEVHIQGAEKHLVADDQNLRTALNI
jgi:hypothetical protein